MFSSPKQKGKENLRPPATWCGPAAATPVKTPGGRLPTVQEQVPTIEDVGFMPAWVRQSPSDAAGALLEDDEVDEDIDRSPSRPEEELPKSPQRPTFNPKVRNTFLQFESPLKMIALQSSPKSEPHGFKPRRPLADISNNYSLRDAPALPYQG